MEASQQYPPEVVEAAQRLGIDPSTVAAAISPQSEPNPAQEQISTDPEKPPIEVQSVPTETREQALERELAESRQETQQVRQMAQTAEAGRVIGSGGAGVVGSPLADLPNLGSLEPGIRYEYLNGLITDQQLIDKVGPLFAALLKKHEGGTP